VYSEIGDALRTAPAGARVAVFGCGALIPATGAPALLFDFDQALLPRPARDAHHETGWAIGIRTALADQSVDLVVITSRLSGLWER
jgi:hypothetical protein